MAHAPEQCASGMDVRNEGFNCPMIREAGGAGLVREWACKCAPGWVHESASGAFVNPQAFTQSAAGYAIAV